MYLTMSAFGTTLRKHSVAKPFTGMVARFFNISNAASPRLVQCAFNLGSWTVRSGLFMPPALMRSYCEALSRIFFARQVVPTIGQLNSLDDFLELLVADKLYFPWSGSNGAIRATQVVAIAGQIGLNDDFVRAMLEPRLKLIAAGLSKTSEMRADPKAYVERILEDWKLR